MIISTIHSVVWLFPNTKMCKFLIPGQNWRWNLESDRVCAVYYSVLVFIHKISLLNKLDLFGKWFFCHDCTLIIIRNVILVQNWYVILKIPHCDASWNGKNSVLWDGICSRFFSECGKIPYFWYRICSGIVSERGKNSVFDTEPIPGLVPGNSVTLNSENIW